MVVKKNTSPKQTPGEPVADGFQLLFHHHPLPMWIYHLETLAFLDVNDVAVQTYGYSRAEFLQMTLRDIRPEEDVPRLLANIAQARNSFEKSSSWRHRLKNGTIIDVEINSHTIEYQGSQAVLVMAQDVTERKRAEESLTNERHWLRTLIDNLPDLIFLKDTDSRFIVANQATAKFMNVASPEVLLGKSDADFYPPERAVQLFAEEQQIIQTGQPIMNHEGAHRDLTGQEYWVSTIKVPLRDDSGQIMGLVGVVRDITSEWQARANLHHSQLRLAEEQTFLRTLINTIPDMVWLKDLNGVYLSCNPAFQRFFGASAQQICGSTDFDLVENHLANSFAESDLATMDTGGFSIFEQWVPHAGQNQSILLETIKTPMRSTNGEIIGVLGIARDITNVRQAQLDLREREAKLNALFKMLPVGISILGADQKIVYANPALTRIFDMPPLGLARNDHLNRRHFRPDGSLMSTAELPGIRVFVENKPVEDMEIGQEKEDGRITWLSISAVPVPFDDWKVLVVTSDITARKQAEQSLTRRLNMETLMSAISASLAIVPDNEPQFNEVLHQALAQLGGFLQIDRISLVRYAAAENTLSTTHQWCADGVPELLSESQNVPVENMPWLEGLLKSGQVTPVRRVSNLPGAEQKLGELYNIKSVLLLPLLRQNQVYGLLSIESINQERIWPEAENNILAAIGQIFAVALERHQITAALQESETRFRQIAENIRDIFYLTDLQNWQLLYISSAFEQIWGFSREVLYTNIHAFIDAIAPEDRPQVQDALARQAQGEATETEYRVIRPDGSTRWVRDRAFPVRNAAGAVTRISGLVADITVYKDLLINLERTNQRLQGLRAIDQAILQADDLVESPLIAALRHLYDLIPCPEAIVYTFNIERNQATILGRIVAGILQQHQPNQTVPLDDLHYNRLKSGLMQLVALTDQSLAGSIDRQRFAEGLQAALLLPLISHGELLGKLTLLAPNLDFFTLHYMEVAAEVASQIALALHQTRLNTQIQQHTIELEQRVAERTAEITQVSQRLELAIQAGEIGVWDWEIKLDRLTWDEQMVRLYGLADKNLRNPPFQLWRQSLYPKDADQVLAEIDAALRNERPFDTEFRIVWPDGSRRHIKATAHVIFDADGQPERMIGVNIDVTERKQAEQKLRRRRDQLSAANAELARLARLKDEFLANMSHELRTPLNAILGLTEILLEGVYGPLNENQARSMRVLEESGRHLLALINDILDVSKMEVGKLTLEVSPVNVEVLCQSSLRLVKESAQKKQLKIDTNFDDTVTVISGDERRLKQLLVNLLSNAVKFTPVGGQIGLEVHGEPLQEVVHLTVWDTGIGIDVADVERLFKPFIQIDNSLSRQHSGTGLGLVLVQRIAELHGGSVTMTSKLNHGSRFTVSLPWSVQTVRPDITDIYQTPPTLLPAQLRHALLVEDHPQDAQLLSDYMADWNVNVTLLPRGENVVEQVISIRPDVILLDLQLPGISGWTVLARLKADPQTRHIPVIISSGLDETAQGLALGAAAYLVKPFSREQLLYALKLAMQPPPPLPAPSNPEDASAPAPLILLAEDNEHNILTMRSFLETQGFRLLVARNGREAITLAAEEAPDLILMDVQMPEMDGLEATRKIRANHELINIPIIAVTALAMPGDRERCLAAGANDYLTKPVSLKILREMVVTLLNQNQD